LILFGILYFKDEKKRRLIFFRVVSPVKVWNLDRAFLAGFG
jgi:hypothetical protein